MERYDQCQTAEEREKLMSDSYQVIADQNILYKLGTFYSFNGPLLGSNKCNTLVDIGMGVLKKFGKG